MTFCHDNHIEVSIWHEWEVRTVPLLATPPAAHAGVSDNHVHVAAHAQPDVTVESDVTSVIRTALKIYREPVIFDIGIHYELILPIGILAESDRNCIRNCGNIVVLSVKSVMNRDDSFIIRHTFVV